MFSVCQFFPIIFDYYFPVLSSYVKQYTIPAALLYLIRPIIILPVQATWTGAASADAWRSGLDGYELLLRCVFLVVCSGSCLCPIRIWVYADCLNLVSLQKCVYYARPVSLRCRGNQFDQLPLSQPGKQYTQKKGEYMRPVQNRAATLGRKEGRLTRRSRRIEHPAVLLA